MSSKATLRFQNQQHKYDCCCDLIPCIWCSFGLPFFSNFVVIPCSTPISTYHALHFHKRTLQVFEGLQHIWNFVDHPHIPCVLNTIVCFIFNMTLKNPTTFNHSYYFFWHITFFIPPVVALIKLNDNSRKNSIGNFFYQYRFHIAYWGHTMCLFQSVH